MIAAYVASLLFGGVLIGASLLGAGADHAGDVHAGTGDDHGGAHGLAAFFGLRFWSFATAFFGAAGLALHLAAGPSVQALAPVIAGVVGVGAGAGASAVFRRVGRQTIGRVTDAGTLAGRQGRLLLPVDPAQRGKVRLALPSGGSIDLLAEASDSDPLPAGEEVIVVEVRGSTAVVTRAPGALSARRP
jgi:membrane protein implicated in regulation of membrane protease activity